MKQIIISESLLTTFEASFWGSYWQYLKLARVLNQTKKSKFTHETDKCLVFKIKTNNLLIGLFCQIENSK